MNDEPIPRRGRDPKGASKPDSRRLWLGKLVLLYQFMSEAIAFVILGVAIDWYWNISPWGALGCGVLGIGGSLILLVRKVLRSQD